jgi:uncharacterized protein
MSSTHVMFKTFSAIIVTGGSSGIGKSYLEHAIEDNPNALICNLSRTPCTGLKSDHVKHITCDLSVGSAIENAFKVLLLELESQPKLGPLLLINNSGFGAYGSYADISLEENLGMVDVNIKGMIHLTSLLLPYLKKAGGAVLNVASTASFQPTPLLATYGATKAFVLNWSLALNSELKPLGIHVMAVCPGPTSTQFFKRAGLAQGSVSPGMSMTSDQVVKESMQALKNRHAFIVTGWKNRLLKNISSLFPRVIVTQISAIVIARYRTNSLKR